MNLPNTPRDPEEKRLRGGTITERAASQEDRTKLPHLQTITPAERARDPEEARQAAGIR